MLSVKKRQNQAKKAKIRQKLSKKRVLNSLNDYAEMRILRLEPILGALQPLGIHLYQKGFQSRNRAIQSHREQGLEL